MNALVSVIMPAWRPRPDWLCDAVASILDESACELELLVVDDGSEAPLAELLAAIDDPRLRVIRVEHRGPYGARDAGLAAARGAFVRFFDADDIAEPGSTGRLLALAAAAGDETIAYGTTLVCDEDLVPRGACGSELEGDVVEACLLDDFEVFVVSFLFPRAVVERAGAWEAGFSVSGDWDFVLRAVEQAPVRRLDEVVSRYRRHASSVTKTADVAAGARAGEQVLARYFARHPQQRGTPLERRAYLRLHLDRARAHAWRGEHRAAVRQLVRAARRDPLAAALAAGRWGASALASRVAPILRRRPHAGRS